jgi:NADH/NAD ratio-sensing transcriptional regulator Rex
MRYHPIPDEPLQRLPCYLRGVQLPEQGVDYISSCHFAEHIGVHPWQIRKDLS